MDIVNQWPLAKPEGDTEVFRSLLDTLAVALETVDRSGSRERLLRERRSVRTAAGVRAASARAECDATAELARSDSGQRRPSTISRPRSRAGSRTRSCRLPWNDGNRSSRLVPKQT